MSREDKIQKIGILGGTFDPVHNGHLALVEEAFAGLDLDSLLLIPAAVPPHKRDLLITPLKDRLSMLSFAVSGRDGLYVSDIEAERLGPSFSVDTVAALRAHFGAEVTLFFIVGIDAFVEIQTWKDYQQLPMLADIVVVNRAGTHSPKFAEVVKSRFVGYSLDAEHDCWRGVNGHGVIRSLAMKPVDISSTVVREFVASGRSVGHFLPDAVAEYIHRRRLYLP